MALVATFVAKTVHENANLLLGGCIGFLAALVLTLAVVWLCAGRNAAEPPVEQPERTPAKAATLERWSLPRVFTGLVPLPVEGVRCRSRNYISEARFDTAWHAGIQAGKFSTGQLAYIDRLRKPYITGRKLQNHFWVLVDGEEPGIYDRWGDAKRRLSGGRSTAHCAWPSIAEASAYWQGALLAKRRRLSGE